MRGPENFIHHSAKVHPTAVIGHGVWIGPNVVVEERAIIGAYSCIGGPPEHRDHFGLDPQTGEPDWKKMRRVFIGPRARLFEMVTVHCGTVRDTWIGMESTIFNHSHIAHDVQLGQGALIGGNVTLAGHVTVGDWAQIAGHCSVHQHSMIGPYAFLSASSYLKGHVPPGQKFIGSPARPAGNNDIGLERAGMTMEIIEKGYGPWWAAMLKNNKEGQKI